MRMWEESMVLGLDAIDKQHQGLVEQMELLSDSLASNKPVQKNEETIQFLEEYTIQHFRDEELLMKGAGYTGYKRHKALHQKFIINLKHLKETTSGKKIPRHSTYMIFRELLTWLTQHILKEDKKMADFIKSV